MSRLLVVSAALLAGCPSSPTTGALCAYCDNDSQCGGNPCFEDVTGKRFCGYPCEAGCPTGYSCTTVNGTSQTTATCYPESESCEANAVDGGVTDGSAVVGDGGPPIGAKIPVAGPIGAQGGTVDRLLFGITGDTRPDRCGTSYPVAIINNIFLGMKQHGVQFALDQGDHMFNCGSQTFQGAKEQMAYYVSAAQLLGKTVFMTMGNHECTGAATALCSLASYGTNANYTAYMDALSSISSTPYYRFDVQTSTGKAAFIVIADDVWDTAEETWLKAQLADADMNAKYTFVSKHHPDNNTSNPKSQQIYNIVRQHPYTLFLTGHSHLYKRQATDGRALVIGCGGAPLTGGTFWGYGTVEQKADDRIYVKVFDQATGNVMDAFDVSPR